MTPAHYDSDPNEDSRRISRSVSKALANAGIPQREAIDATGIPHSTFVRSITGKRPFNTIELAEIAALVGCGLVDLMFHDGGERPEQAAS